MGQPASPRRHGQRHADPHAAAGLKFDEAQVKDDETSLDLFPIWPAGWDDVKTNASQPQLTAAGAVFTLTFKTKGADRADPDRRPAPRWPAAKSPSPNSKFP